MKIFSTRNFLFKCLGAFVLAFSSTMLVAQSTFTVDAPASIAGEYEALPGLWGAYADGSTVTGEIVLADDGNDDPDSDGFAGSTADACQPLSNDVSGKIVFVDRTFICNSFEAHANASGAIGMIVCANDLDENYQNAVRPRGAAVDTLLDFPVFAMDLATCLSIRMQLESGETVSGTFNLKCEADEPENAVWGTTLGSSEDWEVEGDGWQYRADAYVARGAYNSALGYARTQTSCDGAFVFDSDFLDNQGIPGNFGFGDCPTDCLSSVTSPTIDLTASSATSFVVQFDQAIREFNSEHYLAFSSDNGTTWDTIEINDEIPTNSNHLAQTRTVSLCGVSNDSQLKLKFIMNGNYYYWAIDDIYVIAEEIVDVQGNANFFATAPNYRTPITQLDYHAFLTDIENYGNADAQDVNMAAEILNSNADAIFTTGRDYGVVPFCFLDENKVVAETFDMNGLDVGTYATRYTITSSNSTTTEPSVLTSFWQVTDSVYSKVLPEDEAGETYLGNWGGSTLNYISVGNAYYVANDGFKAVSMRAGISAQTTGDEFEGEIAAALYKWNDDNADGNVQADEKEQVAEAFAFELTHDTDGIGDVTLVWESTTGADEVLLEGGEMYLAMVHLAGVDPDGYALRFKGADVEDNRSFDFNAMRYATNELGNPRFGSMIAVGSSFNDVEERVFEPVSNLTCFAPLTIALAEVSTEDINEDLGVSVFPNPAADYLNFDFDLDEASKNVNISLVDVNGKIALSQNFGTIQTGTVKVNVSDIAAGAYSANIRTEAGFISKKVMIVK